MSVRALVIGGLALGAGYFGYRWYWNWSKEKDKKNPDPEASTGADTSAGNGSTATAGGTPDKSPAPNWATPPFVPVRDVYLSPAKPAGSAFGLSPRSGETLHSLSKRAKLRKAAVKQPPGSPMLGGAPMGDQFPLRLGSEGKRVERIQVWLLRNAGFRGKVTGVYDHQTDKLVRRHLKKKEVDQETFFGLEMEKPVHRQRVQR